MNDNQPNLENIKKILRRDKKEVHKETKQYLAHELKNMAELQGEYSELAITQLMREILFMSACYLEEKF